MKLEKATIVKDAKGHYHLLGPGLLKSEVNDTLDKAWEELQKSVEENRTYFREAGLDDESGSFNLRKAFEKSFWLESMLRGVIMLIPLFIGFFIFSYAITGQFTKLTSKIQEAIDPYAKDTSKSRTSYSQSLERYRPYIYETLKVWREESQKVEKEALKK